MRGAVLREQAPGEAAGTSTQSHEKLIFRLCSIRVCTFSARYPTLGSVLGGARMGCGEYEPPPPPPDPDPFSVAHDGPISFFALIGYRKDHLDSAWSSSTNLEYWT